MNGRRNFLRMARAAALPAGAALLAGGTAQADDGSAKEFLGAWNTVHSLPFPPGSFREFLSFADGGVMHETNSFLNNGSNLSLPIPGLPSVLNASDGFGNWERLGKGHIRAWFRKLLFDGSRNNIGDLRASGELHSDGRNIWSNQWTVEIVDPAGNVLVPLGTATSRGVKLT